jgi:hypothetical protein
MNFFAAFSHRPQFRRRTVARLEAGRFPWGCIFPGPKDMLSRIKMKALKPNPTSLSSLRRG